MDCYRTGQTDSQADVREDDMTVRSEWWRGLATDALNKFVSTDSGSESTFGYGMAAGASGILNGWSHATTDLLFTRLLGRRHADGGYGLDYAWDAFNDGTVNPALTSYTVSIAGHAGPALLAAYSNGSTVVARSDVQGCIAELMAMPRITVSRGLCVAYSNHPNDKQGQVHNVNAGVAAFLADCNAAGFGAGGMQRLITGISVYEALGYNATWRGWPYTNLHTAVQDADHDSYTVESVYGRKGGPLVYWVGREAAYRMMNTDFSAETQGEIVHTRLASLPGGPGSWSTLYPGTSVWSELAYTKWKGEQDALAVEVTGDRAAQFAWYAAQNVLHVE
jgi:hypothetical protein